MTAPFTTWGAIDLEPVRSGEGAPERPSYLRRTDGVPLIYPGKSHSFYGEPETCKSFAAAAALARELRASLDVVAIDFEDDAHTWVERLRALGVSDEMTLARFHYVRPEEPITEAGWVELDLAVQGAAIVVFDGVNEGMALQGLNPVDNADVAKWLQITRRCQLAGAAVISIDHVAKDRESRGRYAIGAQAKLAAVDVAYSFRLITPFARGRDGLVGVRVEKDRPGYIRAHQGADGQIAMVRLSSAEDGAVQIEFDPPEDSGASFRPTFLMERISRTVEESPGLSKRAIREIVPGNSKAKDVALGLLKAEGFVELRRDGPAHLHYSKRPFRDGHGGPSVTIGNEGERDHRDPACLSEESTVTANGDGDRDHVTPPFIGGSRGTVPLATPEEEAKAARLLEPTPFDEEPL